ncbi:DUF262 domain-containing protein [Solwaraspora sp. WMMD937]|uniref:DUF262 domain-containing protein n=1 Tax=Solwaraspora sp. WMMD937 TaxID=3016090 RepID=UPI002499BCA7|nr:DUF262 domain-containing protein [Solwaraspora sp. WMMD937]WFE22220.1 DUF262 domain-containing protein [Solwaraspora sp. WMMD937]
MSSSRGDVQVEPIAMMLVDMLEEIAAGRIRVPRFQRPFVWRPEQMLDLFDSIERGWPIGGITVWETTDEVPSLDHLGEVPVRMPPAGTPVSYVLDGHQRLSTLFGVLRRQGRPPRGDDQREWKWRIYRDLEPQEDNERYRHHRAFGSPPPLPPDSYLPMRSVNSTVDFLRFLRNLEARVNDATRMDRLVNEADWVAQRVRAYKIPLVRVRDSDLGSAIEVFARINNRGVRLETHEIASRLTGPVQESTMGEQVDSIVESVASTGFGELPRMAVFRSMLAIAGEPDVMKPHWEQVAQRIRTSQVDVLAAGQEAVHKAVELLRAAGLPLAALLPYSHQLVLLTYFFHCRPEPTGNQRLELERWFWVTSWAGSFAGANSTRIREGLAEMKAFASGATPTLKLDVGAVQPMPEPFNLNSARTLAYVAWEAHEFPTRRDALGQEFDVVKRLAGGVPQAYRQIVPGHSTAANRIILPTSPGDNPLGVFKELRNGQLERTISRDHVMGLLASHCITERAFIKLLAGDHDGFLELRAEVLQERLRAFAKGLGVMLGPDMTGVADNDTEHDE